jgi:hypothetical protein
MGLNCEITVEGRKDGRTSKETKTGPVSSFIVDNQILYGAVLKHLRKCQVCDPREALQAYLDRRMSDPKFGGKTSRSLITNAKKYRNVCKQRGLPIPEDLIQETIWRIGYPDGLSQFAKELGPEGIVRGLIHIKEQDRKARHLTHNSLADICQKALGCSEYVRHLAVIVDNMFTVDRPFPSKQELEDLIAVATVMLS